MYEMIMDLPLFKGVGKDHVSQFLEKTHISFDNYQPGDVVTATGDRVNTLKFLISGKVEIRHPLKGGRLTVTEICGRGRVLGAEWLFGIATGYPFEIVALTKASVMSFRKEQYMNLLQTDNIYLLNFFNYLSLRAQRPTLAVAAYSSGDIHSRLKVLVSVLSEPSAKEVIIEGSEESIAGYCGVRDDEFHKWTEDIKREGLAYMETTGMRIPSRSAFLE